jgi:hypothetical protein
MSLVDFEPYKWGVNHFEEEFFKGEYKEYEESGYMNDLSIKTLRDQYIKGNTALFDELFRIVTESDTNVTTYVSSEDKWIYCSITLNTNKDGKNVLLIHDFENGTTSTFEADTYFLNLKSIINWIVNNDSVPIYVIRKIYTSEKVIYSV